MRYRELGNTGLQVSEIGLGAEWLERHNEEEVKAVIQRCESYGINILDCWMSNPEVRTKIGNAICGHREKWVIQGHFGSTWQEGQYVRTRDLPKVKEAFQDLLTRLQTDYIDLGMIHFVDSEAEFRQVMEGEFLAYVKEQREKGVIRHTGMQHPQPQAGQAWPPSAGRSKCCCSASTRLRPAAPSEDLNDYFVESYGEGLAGIDPCGRSCTSCASSEAWASP